MQTVDLPSWEAFEKSLGDLVSDQARRRSKPNLTVSDLLFRGHGDSSWQLRTTLQRYAPQLTRLSDYYRYASRIKPQIETYFEREWNIPDAPEYDKFLQESAGFIGLPAYDYMIYLRHHGFPSPFLDWSRSPYVAAFFAFSHGAPPPSDRVAIYAYLEFAGNAKAGSSNEPEIVTRGPYVRSHPRHFRQQSEYSLCAVVSDGDWHYAPHEDAFRRNDPAQDLLWKLTIPYSERLKVLRELDQHNLNSFSLFGTEESLVETLALREILFRQ